MVPKRLSVSLALALGVFCSSSLLASDRSPFPSELKDRDGMPVATVDYSATGVSIAPVIDFDRARVVVKGSEGVVYEATSPPASLNYAFVDAQGNPLQDGAYRFEIVFISESRGDEIGDFSAQAAVTAGRFLIRNGQLWVPELDDAAGGTPNRAYSPTTDESGDSIRSVTAEAFDVSGTYSINGKLTIWTDDDPSIAVDGSFGDDLYIKTSDLGVNAAGRGPGIYLERVNKVDEANGANPADQVTHGSFRINYDDDSTTSTGGLFTISSDPGARGGTGSFGERAVLTIEERAPANTLYLEDTGEVGIGTTAPIRPLHIATQGAAIRIDHVSQAAWDVQQFSGDLRFSLARAYSGGSTGEHVRFTEEGNVGIGTSLPAARLHVVGSGIIEGDVALGSSRTIKHEIEPVETGAILTAVRQLPIYGWKYKDDPLQSAHVGPMAEDVHALFRLGIDEKHLSPADSAGLALAAVQGVDAEIVHMRAEIAALATRNAALASENSTLQSRLAAIEERLGELAPSGNETSVD